MSETKKRGRKKAYPQIWETVMEQADGDEPKALKEYHRYRVLADEQGLDADADVDDVKEPEPTGTRPRGRPKGSANKKPTLASDVEELNPAERKGRGSSKSAGGDKAASTADGAPAPKKRGRPKGSGSRKPRGRPPGRPKKVAAAADSADDEADEPQQTHKKKKLDLYEQLLAAKEAELCAEREAKEAQRLRAEAERRRADDLKELAVAYARGQNATGAAAAAIDGDGGDVLDLEVADLDKRRSEEKKQAKQQPQKSFAGSTPAEKQQELRSKNKHDKHAGTTNAAEAATHGAAAAQSPAKAVRGAKP